MRLGSRWIPVLAGAGLLAGVSAAKAADTFKLDPAHTNIAFLVQHFTYSKMLGQFQKFDGTITLDQDDWSKSRVALTVDTASVDTDHAKRDEHLRSPDFFKVKEFPEMTFRSTRVEKTGDRTGRLHGDLTLLGVTRPVALDFTLNDVAPHPLPFYEGVLVAGISARGAIKRSEFGMTYALGGLGDEIELILEVEAHRQ